MDRDASSASHTIAPRGSTYRANASANVRTATRFGRALRRTIHDTLVEVRPWWALALTFGLIGARLFGG